jgi:hypothetical protein
MANAAFYKVITDDSVTLTSAPANNLYERVFDLTSNLDASARSILSISVRIRSAQNLAYEIAVNGVAVRSISGVDGSDRFIVQEVLTTNVGLKKAGNELQVRVTAGSGNFDFSDAVLLYGVSVGPSLTSPS